VLKCKGPGERCRGVNGTDSRPLITDTSDGYTDSRTNGCGEGYVGAPPSKHPTAIQSDSCCGGSRECAQV
jgi:hypothetical protein